MSEDIIRMAREAGIGVKKDLEDWHVPVWHLGIDYLVRFAHLIEQHLISQGYRQCAKGQRTTQFCGLLEGAVRVEREACAKVCDARYMGDNNREDMEARRCAAAIRARGITQDQPLPEDQNPSF